MAMTGQTYTSSSLFPTSTSSPSDSSDPSPTYGGILGSLLTANGSPPLIVAFLAIGLFAVSVIGVFGWRRHSRRRGVGPQPAWTIRHKSVAIGKKPILWDLWASVPNVSINNIEEIRCENIAPFAAVLTFLSPPEQQSEKPSPPLKSTESRHHYHHILLQLLALAVRRFHLSVLPEPPPPAPPPGPADTVSSGEEDSETESRSSDDAELEWEGPSSLGVSVIIAMPTQRTSSSQTPTSEGPGGVDMEREEMGEYCIGTMEVPWSEEE